MRVVFVKIALFFIFEADGTPQKEENPNLTSLD